MPAVGNRKFKRTFLLKIKIRGTTMFVDNFYNITSSIIFCSCPIETFVSACLPISQQLSADGPEMSFLLILRFFSCKLVCVLSLTSLLLFVAVSV